MVYIRAELMKNIVARNADALFGTLIVCIIERTELQIVERCVDIGGESFVDQIFLSAAELIVFLPDLCRGKFFFGIAMFSKPCRQPYIVSLYIFDGIVTVVAQPVVYVFALNVCCPDLVLIDLPVYSVVFQYFGKGIPIYIGIFSRLGL